MNKKSKRKNDLRSSIILLLILLLLLISSTYAWFTANQVVTISTLDVHIEAANGLQISTDATTWKSIISNTDITTGAYADNRNQLPTSMEPVSTVGEIDSTSGDMMIYYGTVNADENDGGAYKLTATKEADVKGTAGKYIAFDIFMRVDKDTQLKLTNASSVVMKEGSSDKGIKQASRVAFCLQGTKPVGTALGDITSQKEAVSFGESGSTVYIWEPNANWHTAAAVAHARDNYGLTTSQSEDGSSVAKVPYYGVNSIITANKDTNFYGVKLMETNNGTNTTYFTQITPSWSTESDEDGVLKAEQNVFPLTAGITKVRVYMWIEGQDVDCENTASGTDISFNLQFQVVE